MTQDNNEDNFVDSLFDGDTFEVDDVVAEKQPQASENDVLSDAEEAETETASPAEQKTETAEDSQPQEETWTKAAALDERRKRQEMEKRLAEMEAKLANAQKQQTVVPEEKPDPVEDPDGFYAYQDKKMFEMALKFDQRQMQKEHTDYDDTVEHFKVMAGKDPALIEAFQKQEFPATFAYQTAKADLMVQKYQDPNFLQNLEKELEEKIIKRLKGDLSSPEKPDASRLPKLSTATSKSSNVEQKVEIDDYNIDGLFANQDY